MYFCDVIKKIEMKTIFNLLLFISFSVVSLEAQMVIGNDTLYGNEWINYNKDYYKIQVAEDGVYRLTHEALLDAGVPVSSIEGDKITMHHMGVEHSIYVSTTGIMGSGDFIEFVGRKNRTELDQYLYKNGAEDLLNTEYSLFNDTSSYYLSWDNIETGLQFDQETFTSSNLNPQTYLIQEDKLNFNHFHLKNINSVKVKFSNFEKGEGFAGDLLVSQNFSLNPERPSSTGPDPELNIRFGSNANLHEAVLTINGLQRATDNFSNYTVRSFDIAMDKTELNAPIAVRLDGTHLVNGGNNDKYAVSELNLKYPRETNIENKAFYSFIVEASGDQKYYEIETQNDAPIIYDIVNNERIEPIVQGGTMKFLLSAGAERRIDIVFPAAIVNKSLKEKVNFIDFSLMDPEFLFISSEKLQSDPQNSSVQRYVDHKSNKFRTALANIEQIYDQFGYGIERHSMSLRNFASYVTRNWSDLEYALIVGKGITYEFYRTEAQINDLSDLFFIPTYGAPGADNLIFSKGQTPDTEITVGRIAVVNEEQVEVYLDKIKLHEAQFNNPQTITERAWMKNVIHMSGGDVDLQPLIANFLGDMEEVLERNNFGANVTTFYKTSSAVLQDLDSEDVLDIIHEGSSIITFFGHSSPGTFDFSLEEPNKWNNEGKNPVMISLGCHSGNIHNTHTEGLSEKFVLEPKFGALGFMASAGTAYVTPQYNQGLDAYSNLGASHYGESIGNAYTDVRQNYSFNTAIDFRSLVQQMTYHGDPSILLYPTEAQDYVFDYSTAKINPRFVSSGDETFDFSVDVLNLGRNDHDTLELQFVYQLPDGTIADTVNISFLDTIFRQNVSVEFDVEGLSSLGENLILGEIDFNNKIDELPNPAAENNNRLNSSPTEDGFKFYILDNTAKPFSPCEFGVVADGTYSLKAATSNAFAPEQTYVMEMDTTINFNSPSLETTRITQGGGIIEWNPTTVLENETVYYWRISPDSTSIDNPYVWQASSFTLLANEDEGWNQSHIYQWESDDLLGLDFDEGHNMIFGLAGRPVEIINAIWDQSTVGTKVNNSGFSASQRPWRILTTGGVAFGVVDPLTGKFWVNSGGDYGSVNSSNFATHRAFAYRTNTKEERDLVIDFVENVVPDDHYITFYTMINSETTDFRPEEWAQDSIISGKNIFNVFEQYGAMQIRLLEQRGSVPYIFMFKKSTGLEEEVIAEQKTDYITGKITTLFLNDQGSLTTNKIGPAKEWHRLQWENEATVYPDSTNLHVYAYDNNNELDSIYEYNNLNQGDIDLSFLDADQFPFIELLYKNFDLVDRSSPQLNHLRVLYKGYPDLAINLEEHFVFNNDTLQQGELLEISFAIENIYSEDVDSIDVLYSILTENNALIEQTVRSAPIDANGFVTIDFSYDTRELIGNNQIHVVVNPNASPVEKQRFNNILIKEFNIVLDEENPVLDVTFDGIHILDGDLVSAKPFIKISLKDENPNIFIEDPETFVIELTDPNGQREILNFNDPQLQFIAATEENLTAYVEYSPEFLVEGKYELEIQGKDATGNKSGDNNLIKAFTVILEDKVSNVLNYPNPFSTSTQFIFTLTGTTVPEHIVIRIMSLSGKVVREITKEELGNLRIGVNRTSYKWDGTDEYGSKLANGVYLYKVFMSDINGTSIENYGNESIDDFFDQGFGKMVIMR